MGLSVPPLVDHATDRMFAPDITLRRASTRIGCVKKKINHYSKLLRIRALLIVGAPRAEFARGAFGSVRATIFFIRSNEPSLPYPPTTPNSSTTHQSAPSSPHPSKSHPATAAQIPPSPTSASHQSPSSNRNPESAKH